jgi:hypothetical protein
MESQKVLDDIFVIKANCPQTVGFCLLYCWLRRHNKQAISRERIMVGIRYWVLTLALFFHSQAALSNSELLAEWGVSHPETIQCDTQSLSKAEQKLYLNIASKAFTWTTGSVEQAEYEPVGELANYFGFARLRNDIRDSTNNSQADVNFRGSSWKVVLENLNKPQREILYTLNEDHASDFHDFLRARVALVRQLYGLKQQKPLNTEIINQSIVDMGRHEANITLLSAGAYSSLNQSLTEAQIATFKALRKGNLAAVEMKGKGPYTQDVAAELKSMSADQIELLTEVSSKYLSYQTGSVEDSVYLPPGKIANYFGFAYYRYEDRAKVSRSQAAKTFIEVLNQQQRETLQCLAKEIIDYQSDYIEERKNLIHHTYSMEEVTSKLQDQIVKNYLHGAIAEGRIGAVEGIYFDYVVRSLNQEQLKLLKEKR